MAGNPPKELSFVTATKLEHFKDRGVMQKVRKAVMRDYLDKAKDDPKTTDVRAKKKSPPATQPIKSEPQSAVMPPPETVRRPDSGFRRDSHTSYERRRPSRPASIASSSGDSSSGKSTKAINPVIRPTPNQESLFALADSLNKHAAPPSTYPGQSKLDPILAPGSTIAAEKMSYLVAFTRRPQDAWQPPVPDPFANHDALPTTVDLDRLKVTCATYFGSHGMSEKWLPLMLTAPHAFLASLCISAPYSDLMAADQSGDEPASYADTRQTMEILDIVPRMINDKLNENGPSDSNITAVVQLLLGQLSSPYTALIGSHQNALKRMVNLRGGLDKLGGNGALALNLVITHTEANILRNEPGEPAYTQWMASYLAKNPTFAATSPEGPLHWVRNGMRSIAASPLCRSETLELILLMQELTEKVIRLRTLEENEREGNMDVIISQATEKSRIMDRIRGIVLRTHEMPPCHRMNPGGTPDWIYESIRLTSLLFSHAVWYHRPLHHNFECSLGCQYRITPEMIQDAVRHTALKPFWDHLAGVCYWVLMISAAACHDPVGETTSDLGSPKQSLSPRSPARPATTIPTPLPPHRSTRVTATPPPPARPATVVPVPSSSTASTIQAPAAPTESFLRAANTYSAGKRLFEEYYQSRETNFIGGQLSDMRISEGTAAEGSQFVTAGPATQRQDEGDDGIYEPQCVPLYFRDTGFAGYEAYAGPTGYSGEETGQAATATVVVESSDEGQEHMEGQRRRRRRMEKRVSDGEMERRKQAEKRAYVKRFLTANAVRVSLLLRFEHVGATVESVKRLEEVTRWLNRL